MKSTINFSNNNEYINFLFEQFTSTLGNISLILNEKDSEEIFNKIWKHYNKYNIKFVINEGYEENWKFEKGYYIISKYLSFEDNEVIAYLFVENVKLNDNYLEVEDEVIICDHLIFEVLKKEEKLEAKYLYVIADTSNIRMGFKTILDNGNIRVVIPNSNQDNECTCHNCSCNHKSEEEIYNEDLEDEELEEPNEIIDMFFEKMIDCDDAISIIKSNKVYEVVDMLRDYYDNEEYEVVYEDNINEYEEEKYYRLEQIKYEDSNIVILRIKDLKNKKGNYKTIEEEIVLFEDKEIYEELESVVDCQQDVIIAWLEKENKDTKPQIEENIKNYIENLSSCMNSYVQYLKDRDKLLDKEYFKRELEDFYFKINGKL